MNNAVNNLCISLYSTILSYAVSLVAPSVDYYQEVMGLNPDKSIATSSSLETKKAQFPLLIV